MLAKTEAAGATGLLPEVLEFSSSLSLDLKLAREDLLGSLAHLGMLARTGIIPKVAAGQIHRGLVEIWRELERGTLQLPAEEDVHMAVEAELTKRLGGVAGLLHTARSRNDQVALDLRLHVREQCAEVLRGLGELITYLAARAEAEQEILLPSYTHRQRAQPISLAYLLCSYGAMLTRDADAFTFVLDQTDAMPLGVGAIAGTSLPIDRAHVQRALGFSRITMNGIDTVGDRDFALDYTYAAAKFMLHASRLSADMIDFTTAEFGYAKLDGEIACGSSMMPQKRNPDVFELVRGRSGQAVGNLVALLVTVKGLPAGYNRDLQEDRRTLLETGPLTRSVLSILQLALPRVVFDKERCRAGVEKDAMQATDMADALVRKGLPFRSAYKLVGALVRSCQEKGIPLAEVTPQMAAAIDPQIDAAVLETANALRSVSRKISAGSTGPEPVKQQIAQLRSYAEKLRERGNAIPRLGGLFTSLAASEP